MPKPFKHPKSGVYYYRKVVPGPLRGTLGRGEYRISLGTKDLQEAKRRYPAVASRVDAELSRAAGGPIGLMPRQVAALAGIWYRRETDVADDKLLSPEEYEAQIEALQAAVGAADENPAIDTFDVEKARAIVDPAIDELLRSEGLVVDARSRRELAAHIYVEPLVDGGATANASGHLRQAVGRGRLGHG